MRMRMVEMLVAVTALALGGCATTSGDVAPGETCEFEFPFMNDYDVINRTTFAWDDSYVTNSPTTYRQELAGPLCALAASTYGFRLFTDIRSLMDMGFPPERVRRCYGKALCYDDPKYGRDRVGYTLAVRHSELPGSDYEIVMVLVRGTFGRDEWISNVNLANKWGEKPDPDPAEMPRFHEGFSLAADSVMDALAEFVGEQGIDLSKAKILVTGHSRGAAVANLIGARLDLAGMGKGAFAAVRPENVYVYTFATPGVTIQPTEGMKDPKFGNIFNVINPEDIVPTVPFAFWGAGRFGHDLHLRSCNFLPFTGTWSHPGYVGMKNAFREICGYDYYHLIGGVMAREKIGGFARNIVPTVRSFYSVPPAMRAEGKRVCTQTFLEMVFWNRMASADDAARRVSLMSDMSSIASAYGDITNQRVEGTEPKRLDHRLRFIRRQSDGNGQFDPDGRDFSRQPGMGDVIWQLSCTHSFLTYLAWMKSADAHGPSSVFYNWDDEADVPHNDWWLDNIF